MLPRLGLVLDAGSGRSCAWGDAARLAPYPLGVLGVPRLADLLERLGVRTVGALAALPERKVLARFGAEGIAAHRTARRQYERPLSVRTDAGEHTVSYVFEPAAHLLEPVVFAAKASAEQLHERLAAAGVVRTRLEAVVELADGRSLSRTFRHEGRLSSLAVAERVRGVLHVWTDAGLLDAGGEEGTVRLVLRPEELTAATGRQSALFGEGHAPEEIERPGGRASPAPAQPPEAACEVGGVCRRRVGNAPVHRVGTRDF